MGQQNNVLYEYLSDPERFADIFNVSQFGGEQVLCAEQLISDTERYVNKEEQLYREKSRDIKKVLRDGSVFRIFALENQSYVNYIMPLRCMEYDVREYRRQVSVLEKENREKKRLHGSDEYLSGLRETDRIIPIYTVVIYWGEKKWRGPHDLADMMEFAGNKLMKDLFYNYPMRLVCINEIEDCENYRTDLREVIRLLKCRGDKEKMYSIVREREEYQHLAEDTYDVLVLLLGEKKLSIKKEKVYSDEKGGYDMCQALKELIEDGRKEGRREGIKEGEGRMLRLLRILDSSGRYEELSRALNDDKFRLELCTEYGII